MKPVQTEDLLADVKVKPKPKAEAKKAAPAKAEKPAVPKKEQMVRVSYTLSGDHITLINKTAQILSTERGFKPVSSSEALRHLLDSKKGIASHEYARRSICK